MYLWGIYNLFLWSGVGALYVFNVGVYLGFWGTGLGFLIYFWDIYNLLMMYRDGVLPASNAFSF